MDTSSKLPNLLNREKGQYPISIATSLAIESLFNIHPDYKHDYLPIEQVSSLWLNIRTIYRNLYGSMERTIAESLSHIDLAYGIMDDISNIREAILGYKDIPIYLYYSEYDIHPSELVKLKTANTAIQKYYQMQMDKSIEYLRKENYLSTKDKDKDSDVYLYTSRLLIPELSVSDGHVLTSYPFDLLSKSNLSNITLLESHTGRLKTRKDWYTRYYNGNTLHELPFRPELYQIYGDGVLVSPMHIKIRSFFNDLAVKYRWTYATTKDRIHQGVSYSGDFAIMALWENITKTSLI